MFFEYKKALCFALFFAVTQTWAQSASSNPLLGSWRCHSSIRISPSKEIPAGVLTQNIAYKSDSKGGWASNGVLQFTPANIQENLTIHTVSSGIHYIRRNVITEEIQRFRIISNPSKESSSMQNLRKNFQAIIEQSIRKNNKQHYRILKQSKNEYIIQPLTERDQRTSQKIVCKKIG